MHADIDTCHVCGHDGLRHFPDYTGFYLVASDCSPVHAHGKLAACVRCGTVQKVIDGNFQELCDNIYEQYCVYQQSGGEEQKVFSQNSGMPQSRSARLLQSLADQGLFPEQGRLLDVGCGNGNLLRSFHELRPGWGLWGCELHDINRRTVEAIPGVEGFHAGDVADLDMAFDCISLLHTLEHIIDPLAFLAVLKKKLKPGGLLLVDVPNRRSSPFDLVVADHASHFDKTGLENLIVAAGFEIVHSSDSIVPKELSLLARRTDAEPQALPACALDEAGVDRNIAWLAAFRDQAAQASETGELCVFGTSIAAIWLLAELGSRIAFFVDEDADRVGRTAFDIPIIGTDEIGGRQVVMPFPVEIAQRIIERLSGVDAAFLAPPTF